MILQIESKKEGFFAFSWKKNHTSASFYYCWYSQQNFKNY